MTDNDNKSEGVKRGSPFESISIFTKKKEQGATAEAEAPAVVDSEKEEAKRNHVAAKPASWKSSEASAIQESQQAVAIKTDEIAVAESVTQDNKLSTQHDYTSEQNAKPILSAEPFKAPGIDNVLKSLESEGQTDLYRVQPKVEEKLVEEDTPKLCSELRFNLPASQFSLVSFFPDSHYAVILKNGHYHTANLGTEVVDPTPYLNFETLLISDSMVVLAVTELNNAESLLFLTDKFEGKRVRYPSEAKLESLVEECMEDGSYEFTWGKQTFSLLSNGKHKQTDNRSGYYAYPSGTFNYDTSGYLVFEEPNGVDLLLADAHGCYVGFYLPLASDTDQIKIMLGPDYFINPKRLTQTLMVVTSEETNEQSLLTCSRPMLVELADLGIKDDSQIEVSNGVAMITQEVKGSTCINVFTPKHQRIIIDHGIKIDTLSIGNGVYLPTEGVVLLDDGRLLFAREEDDGSVFIRGNRVDLPQQFLEIN